jgi:imidazolonepropionase-like amidohydrolase
VVDVAAGRTLPDQTVLITGSRITAVGPSSDVRAPRGARTIPGNGKYLIPGLWDLHVHLWQVGEPVLPVLVAYGITGVRDMGGDFQALAGWRRRIAADSLVGPDLVLSGPRLDGPPAKAAIDRLLLTTPAAATAAVDSLATLGVDFLKIYEGLPSDAFFAVAREARAKKLPFAGHVPRAVGALTASDSGQASIEHIGFIPADCLAMFDPGAIAAKVPVPPLCRGEGLDTVFRHFARNGTWLDPTVVSFAGFVRAMDQNGASDSGMRFVSPDLVRGWTEQLAGFPKWPVATWKALLGHVELLVGIMRRSEVPILTGTDLGNPDVFPGSSLHEELGLLVQSGYSPAEVLRAATMGAARYLGRADSLGTIAVGKRADLVLLDADPLAAIGNTRAIAGVALRGRWFTRATLDAILAAGTRR